MSYSSNLANLLNGYTGYPIEEEVTKETRPTLSYRDETPAGVTADARDTLSFLAGKGYTSLNDDDSKAAFKSLSKTVGQPMAQKLATQIFLFNQRPEVKKQSPEERVQSFYGIGSNDNDVSNFLSKIKSFGSGVRAGFNDSVYHENRKMVGKEKSSYSKSNNENKIPTLNKYFR